VAQAQAEVTATMDSYEEQVTGVYDDAVATFDGSPESMYEAYD